LPGNPVNILKQAIQQLIRRPLAHVRPCSGWYDPSPVFLAKLDDQDRNLHHPEPGFSINNACFLRKSVATILRAPFSLEVQVHEVLLRARQFESRRARLVQVLHTYSAGIKKALDHAEQATGRALIRLDLEDGCTNDHAAVSPADSFYAFSRQKRHPAVGLFPDPYTLGDLANSVEFSLFNDEQSALEDYRQRKPLIFWRGATTGRPAARRIAENRRACFCIETLRFPGSIDAKITSVVQFPSNPQAFRALRKAGVMAPQVPEAFFTGYQATVDLDGNASAWGGLRKHLHLMHVIRPAGPNEMFYHVGQPPESYTAVRNLHELFHMVQDNPRLADNFAVAWRGYLYAREIQRKITAGDATVFPRSPGN